MKIVGAQRQNYMTFFEAKDNEIAALLRWYNYCRTKSEEARRSSANTLWATWLDETFIGFSASNKVLLHSGHRVFTSYPFSPVLPHQTLFRRLRNVMGILFGRPDISNNLNFLLSRYNEYFPNFKIPESENILAETFPSQYLHACETYALQEKFTGAINVTSLFEIGAGAGVHMALLARRAAPPPLQLVICDLPQTIFCGYLFLRTMLPEYDILLPDEYDAKKQVQQGVIQYVVPEQLAELPSNQFDMALNTQSFQEMDINTVNSYLVTISRILKPDGLLVSKNSRVSRHIKGNSLTSYDVSSFSSKGGEAEAQFTNAINPFDCVFACWRK